MPATTKNNAPAKKAAKQSLPKAKANGRASRAPKVAPKPVQPQSFSINELSTLTKLDRRTVTRRLEGIASKPGPNNAKMYTLRAALPALISGESVDIDEAKLRKMQAEAHLKEMELATQREEVVSVQEVRTYVLDLFKRMFNHIAKRFPREIAKQLYKAESAAQITEILRRELERTFNDIRKDHQRFL